MNVNVIYCLFFFFNDTATTEIYTLSLHDALPILRSGIVASLAPRRLSSVTVTVESAAAGPKTSKRTMIDRKSTRLNSSHVEISYAVFCLKKKKQDKSHNPRRGAGLCDFAA